MATPSTTNNVETIAFVDRFAKSVTISFPNIAGFVFRLPVELSPPFTLVSTVKDHPHDPKIVLKQPLHVPDSLICAFRCTDSGQTFELSPAEAMIRVCIAAFRALTCKDETLSHSMRASLAAFVLAGHLQLVTHRRYWAQKLKDYMRDSQCEMELANHVIQHHIRKQHLQQPRPSSPETATGQSSSQEQQQPRHRASNELLVMLQLQIESQAKRIRELEAFMFAKKSFNAFNDHMTGTSTTTGGGM